jgi:transposase-like protein
MGKIKRKFDVEFKIRLCQAIEGGMTTVADACRDYQIQKGLIEGWLAKYVAGGLEAQSATRLRALEKENEKLKAKVGELTLQIDVLKKIDDWKRRHRSVDSAIITAENLDQFRRSAEPQGSAPRPTTTGQRGQR